ncbi:hypothetical protein TcarDRAFT_0334 [Thermosinus carboxydivorans Nor1]|uniref:Uncharacterized protein n=1 Tax=Thermosinus carboxydivorans Nor1 TaxID=401526 RepID=A1HTK5_9FIRM|nr:hypothetical protein TcarDRAFT_0334 [Thermosinus carboxydivorans Nor1]
MDVSIDYPPRIYSTLSENQDAFMFKAFAPWTFFVFSSIVLVVEIRAYVLLTFSISPHNRDGGIFRLSSLIVVIFVLKSFCHALI